MNRIELNIILRMFFLLLIMLSPCISQSQEGISRGFRTVPDSVKTSFRNDKDYAYANDPAYWKKEKPVDNTSFLENLFKVLQSPLARLIVYLLLIGIFVFVAYRILFVLGVFDRSAGRSSKLHAEHELTNTSQDDIMSMLQQAISNGDLRLATRYHYLHLLKILSDRKLIQLHARSTNRDYINQVNGSSIASSFRTLTRIYEHVWYGESPVTAGQYEFIDQHFKQLKSSLHS